MGNRAKMQSVIKGTILVIFCIIIALLFLLDPMKIDEKDIYSYEGVDCYISFDVNRSLSNISDVMDRHDFSYEVKYNRSSPDGTRKIVDSIKFSYNYSSPKYVSGDIYNFNSDNLTIKLHYYPDDHPDREKSYKTAEEARNLTYSRYLIEKDKLEPDVDYIISIFNLEFNSSPRSVNYVQLIIHSIFG